MKNAGRVNKKTLACCKLYINANAPLPTSKFLAVNLFLILLEECSVNMMMLTSNHGPTFSCYRKDFEEQTSSEHCLVSDSCHWF